LTYGFGHPFIRADAALLEAQARPLICCLRDISPVSSLAPWKAVSATQQAIFKAHVDLMASQVSADTTTEEMEAALEEALTYVRRQRVWQP
jgi:hypothetical protein